MTPTRILLIGMWTILTKKPMKPMIKKPIPVALAILANSTQYQTTNKKVSEEFFEVGYLMYTLMHYRGK